MSNTTENNGTRKILVDAFERALAESPLLEIHAEKAIQIANAVAAHAHELLSAKQDFPPLSRKLTREDLSPNFHAPVCTMASRLSTKKVSDTQAALRILEENGFEIREFANITFLPRDTRLTQAPGPWIFMHAAKEGTDTKMLGTQNVVMICEVRPKPDVSDDVLWMQEPYVDDPFAEQLRSLHEELDGGKTDKVSPISRAGFTFNELQNAVLPELSKKAGLKLQTMPAMYACVLANDHPGMSEGRSTEWREKMSETHAIISGRAARGPIGLLYYDSCDDPYRNRGFRLCAVLGTHSTPTSDSPS